MEEFHRKSSGKKECIVGKKNVKKKEERRKTDGSEKMLPYTRAPFLLLPFDLRRGKDWALPTSNGMNISKESSVTTRIYK